MNLSDTYLNRQLVSLLIFLVCNNLHIPTYCAISMHDVPKIGNDFTFNKLFYSMDPRKWNADIFQ